MFDARGALPVNGAVAKCDACGAARCAERPARCGNEGCHVLLAICKECFEAKRAPLCCWECKPTEPGMKKKQCRCDTEEHREEKMKGDSRGGDDAPSSAGK